MNQLVYKQRCRCNENPVESKRSNYSIRPVKYPFAEFEPSFNVDEYLNELELEELSLEAFPSTIFQIKYDKKLSVTAKFVLNSFHNKYFYYAIDDILYSFKSNPIERDNVLSILYAPVLSLHNNRSVNFFDIWIGEIYINERSKSNKFLINDSQNLEQFTSITLKLLYQTRLPAQKTEPLW